MPPSLATALTVGFIVVLLYRDARKPGQVSKALWLPVAWMAITGTRFVSQWINLGTGVGVDAGRMHEGSPIDAAYFGTVIAAGIIVLARRHIVIGDILRNNRWLVVFLIYGFVAITWSDFPFIAFKRWVKTLGHPVMALIIITDPDPKNALSTVLKRCAFVMMPLSVLLIKYYPEIGRGYSPWTGEPFNNGAMLNKNELGYGCMLFGLFFFWNLLTSRSIRDRRVRRDEFLLSFGFLYIIGWLLYMANSATSFAALLLGILTMSALNLRFVNKRSIGIYIIVAIGLGVFAQLSFDIYSIMLELLGRDPTLTDRTKLWADAMALVNNPILGAGFESFWLGPRLEALWAERWWRPNQAHNGYVETYLNLGAVGVFLLVGLIIATFQKVNKQFLTDFDFARLRLGFLIAILFYNYTEAAFKAVHLVWTVFYIIAIDYPKPLKSQEQQIAHERGRPKNNQNASPGTDEGSVPIKDK